MENEFIQMEKLEFQKLTGMLTIYNELLKIDKLTEKDRAPMLKLITEQKRIIGKCTAEKYQSLYRFHSKA